MIAVIASKRLHNQVDQSELGEFLGELVLGRDSVEVPDAIAGIDGEEGI
jgi:hypothetical protein